MLLLLELCILLAAAVASAPLWLSNQSQLYLPALAFALVMVFSMGTLGMYQHDQSREHIKSTCLRIMPSFVLGFCLMHLLAVLLPAMQLGRPGSMVFLLSGGAVLLARLVVFTSAQSSMLEQRLIIVGDGALARECLALAGSSAGFHPFRVVGFVPVQGEMRAVPPAMLLPADLPLLTLARRYAADEIVVTVSDRRNGAFPVRQLLECALGGVPVTDAASFFEREACQIRVDSLQPSYLIFGGGFDQSLLRATVKRLFDLLASAAIVVLAAPVMLFTALAIKIEDGGPVFYRQERVGRDMRLFKVLKFRSMRQDAERDGRPKWAEQDDPRVTAVGHWIRKLRIDELPQMLNVFKGEMSFVGPRPERAYFVEQLCEQIAYYNVRHGIKPGITGLAQVRYRYGASVEDALQNVLGLSFKENCPDLRNSKVADLIHELESYGLHVHVHDPVADADEALHEYGVQLAAWEDLPAAEALICAVAHRELMARPLSQMLTKVAPGGCFIDLKSQFDPTPLRESGLSVWRL
nr:TIGR03013 family XrtA/PEP-CTERM system glycosyltransferase [Duganella lactea]